MKMLEMNYLNKDDVDLNKYNRHTGGGIQKRYFCVFRIGKKIKSMNQFQAIEKHMEREINVLNADPKLRKYNRILIGDKNIYINVQKYIEGIKLRSNCNLGIDLVLTTGNGFFDNMSENKREKWINANIKFLKDNFHENCIYAALHLDETTPHIHSICIPKFFDKDKGIYKLQSNKYFDGIEKMRDWQDRYAQCMQQNFPNLMRGIRGSKARHMDIKTYYSLINKKLVLQDDNQILEYAKRNFLIEKRLKSLEYTLKRMNENGDAEVLLKNLRNTKKNNSIYKKLIKEITKKYGIKEKEILEILDKIEGKNKQKERV
ncbi:hypothetical protein FDB14_17400 [Clostridium botulinum]|nr:hypothetical protein [Clostridium botulinum]NFK97940.1 hypothetical protein [Clostridium botulinum]